MKAKFLKTIAIVFALAISATCVYGQNKLTYSGPYEDKRIDGIYGGVSGIATYEYYENKNQERIFDGMFSLKRENLSINGSFKNDLKSGHWKYVVYQRPDRTNFQSCVVNAEGEYLKGKLNGVWIYSLIDKKTGKRYSYSKAYFVNNLMIGTFEFIESSRYKFEIKINYDSIGNLDGSYYVKYWINGIAYQDQRKYRNGEILNSLYRNLATGEKLDNKSYKYENGDFWELYDAMVFWKCRSEEYNGGIDGYNPIYILAKGTDPIIDYSAKEEKLRNDVLMKNIKTINNIIFSGDSSQSNHNFEDAHQYYMSAKSFCQDQSMQIPYELISKLTNCETAIKNKEKEEKVKELILEADRFESAKDFNNAIVKIENANQILPNKNLESRIIAIRQNIYNNEIKLKKTEQELKQKKYELALYSADSIAKEGQLENAYQQLMFAQSISTAYISHLDRQIIDRKDYYERLVKNVNKTRSNHEIIISSNFSKTKNEIFQAYIEIYLFETTKKLQYDEYSKVLFELSRIQDNIIKSVMPEKKLKKFTTAIVEAENIEMKIALFSKYPRKLDGENY